MRRLFVIVLAVAAALATTGAATAAQLIDRNATGVKLAANAKGEALLTYRAGGQLKHILVWGAVNARQPSKDEKQVKFRLDYSGGYGKYHKNYWQTFGNGCKPYDGPALTFAVATCKASDGSYWAAQSWQQALPDLGFAPWTPALGANWLEVSHWTGPIAQLEVHTDWIYSGRFHDIFGKYTYDGQPVYGFGTTSVGAPTDNFGRLIYLDTLDAPHYGPGWRRENSFVPHNPTGVWCYGFYTFDPTKGGYQYPPGQTAMRGPGNGSKYRLTAGGPGVTPNVTVVVPGLHDFNPGDPADVTLEQQQNGLVDQLMSADKGGCKQH